MLIKITTNFNCYFRHFFFIKKYPLAYLPNEKEQEQEAAQKLTCRITIGKL